MTQVTPQTWEFINRNHQWHFEDGEGQEAWMGPFVLECRVTIYLASSVAGADPGPAHWQCLGRNWRKPEAKGFTKLLSSGNLSSG